MYINSDHVHVHVNDHSFLFSDCILFQLPLLSLHLSQEEFDAEARSNQQNAACTDELLALQLQHEDLKVEGVCAVLISSFHSSQIFN